MNHDSKDISYTQCSDLAATLLTLGYDIAPNPDDPTKVKVRAQKVLGRKNAKGEQRIDYSFQFDQDSSEFDAPAKDIIGAWEAEKNFMLALDEQLLALQTAANSTGNPDAVRAVNNMIKLLPLALSQYCRTAAQNRINLVTWVIKHQRANNFQTAIVAESDGRTDIYDVRMTRADVEALRATPLPKRS